MGQCQISLLYNTRNPKVRLPWLLHTGGSFTAAGLLFSFIYLELKARQIKSTQPMCQGIQQDKGNSIRPSQPRVLDRLVTFLLASEMDQETSLSPAAYVAHPSCLPTPNQSPNCSWRAATPGRWGLSQNCQDCTSSSVVWPCACALLGDLVQVKPFGPCFCTFTAHCKRPRHSVLGEAKGLGHIKGKTRADTSINTSWETVPSSGAEQKLLTTC